MLWGLVWKWMLTWAGAYDGCMVAYNPSTKGGKGMGEAWLGDGEKKKWVEEGKRNRKHLHLNF